MNTEKILYIIRGASGAGKTTLAKTLRGEHYEADMYFMKDGVYNFDATKLHQAHKWCFEEVEEAMELHFPRIIVSNTFTTQKELKPYIDLAIKHGYIWFSIIVENRQATKDVHNVPQGTLAKQKARFHISL